MLCSHWPVSGNPWIIQVLALPLLNRPKPQSAPTTLLGRKGAVSLNIMGMKCAVHVVTVHYNFGAFLSSRSILLGDGWAVRFGRSCVVVRLSGESRLGSINGTAWIRNDHAKQNVFGAWLTSRIYMYCRGGKIMHCLYIYCIGWVFRSYCVACMIAGDCPNEVIINQGSTLYLMGFLYFAFQASSFTMLHGLSMERVSNYYLPINCIPLCSPQSCS